jgi:hypothetical protein
LGVEADNRSRAKDASKFLEERAKIAEKGAKNGNAEKKFSEKREMQKGNKERKPVNAISIYRQRINFKKGNKTLEEAQRSGKLEGRGQ